MGGLSFWHLLLLLVIVLVIFGPGRLPTLGRSMGEAIRGFKKGLGGEDELDVTNSAKREELDGNKTGSTQTQSEKKNEKV